MKHEDGQLAVLRRMRTEGRITDEEYEDLAKGFVAVNPVPVEPDGEVENVSEDEPTAEAEPRSADEFLPPTFRHDLTSRQVGAVLVASIVVFVISSQGLLSWFIGMPAILLLLTTFLDGWRRVTIIGVGVLAAITIVSLVISVGPNSPKEQTVAVPSPPQDPYPPIPGSLGIYMGQLTEAWNTVDGPPLISRGLTRHNEIGEYDSFIYRFGEWGRLAGAYDPGNEALYALVATAQFSGAGADQLYLHLCFVVAPYSQECIESYNNQGLDGGTLEAFANTSRQSEWTLGEHVWRLQIDRNVLTIRVYGADAA